MKINFSALLFVLISCVLLVAAQTKPKFSYVAQKQLLPVELGQVYLGMPFREFARKLDFTKSEIDDRYGWLEVRIPYNKGNVTELYFKVHGLEPEELTNLSRTEMIKEKGEFGDYEREVKRLIASKIPAKGFVYEIILTYKPSFDLKSYLLKTYGQPFNIHKKGESGYFYDSQWTKKTTDGLRWMIRAFHEESKTLQLIGIIDKTEWDTNA